MANKKSKANQEITYVGLYDAKDLRKDILTTAKELLILIKDLQVQKIKNKARLDALKNANSELKEVSSLSNNVLEALPKSKVSLSQFKNTTKEFSKKIGSREAMNESELSTIDNQIKKIESLLRNL